MGNFYTDTIQQDPRFKSTKRCADLSMLEPVTRAAVQAIVAESPVEVMVFETYRSQERQEQLYEQGVTQLQHVGVHHFGLAADIVKVVDGEPNWDGDFSFLGPLAEKHDLIWGGDWGQPDRPHSFRDYVHVQRIQVADQGKLFRGEWYPDSKYSPV